MLLYVTCYIYIQVVLYMELIHVNRVRFFLWLGQMRLDNPELPRLRQERMYADDLLWWLTKPSYCSVVFAVDRNGIQFIIYGSEHLEWLDFTKVLSQSSWHISQSCKWGCKAAFCWNGFSPLLLWCLSLVMLFRCIGCCEWESCHVVPKFHPLACIFLCWWKCCKSCQRFPQNARALRRWAGFTHLMKFLMVRSWVSSSNNNSSIWFHHWRQ